jgi:hypothetical protein
LARESWIHGEDQSFLLKKENQSFGRRYCPSQGE